VARGEAYLHAKFHLHSSNCLATIHQHYRQDRQTDRTDRQRSDSIGRTVLQTVAQKITHRWQWHDGRATAINTIQKMLNKLPDTISSDILFSVVSVMGGLLPTPEVILQSDNGHYTVNQY